MDFANSKSDSVFCPPPPTFFFLLSLPPAASSLSRSFVLFLVLLSRKSFADLSVYFSVAFLHGIPSFESFVKFSQFLPLLIFFSVINK